MSKSAHRTAAPREATLFAPPTPEARAALTAECLEAIRSGRPLPEAVRPAEVLPSRPASVQAGVERILGGR